MIDTVVVAWYLPSSEIGQSNRLRPSIATSPTPFGPSYSMWTKKAVHFPEASNSCDAAQVPSAFCCSVVFFQNDFKLAQMPLLFTKMPPSALHSVPLAPLMTRKSRRWLVAVLACHILTWIGM